MKDQANQKRYRALIPVANGNEDLEVIAMIDVLRRADIEVVIASVNNEDTVTLMKGSRLVVDAPLLNVVQ
jgi:4-methyl-5(b-hydroxyethyl)-thiazole monophosphate biosynthesis